MAENRYQRKLINKLRGMFPGCLILKNDPNYLQGVPDILILYKECWGALEVKDASDSEIQPNQEHYVSLMGEWSFAAFIYPENEKEVLHELQQAFSSSGAARIS